MTDDTEEKQTRYIVEDEWYPVLTLKEVKPYRVHEVTVTNEFLTKYERILKEFIDLQGELRALKKGLNR